MKSRRNKKNVKRTSHSYWWDFGKEGEIIVESDDTNLPVVARFAYDPINGGEEARGEIRQFCVRNGLSTRVGHAADAIMRAENLIDDIVAGRRNHRQRAIAELARTTVNIPRSSTSSFAITTIGGGGGGSGRKLSTTD